MIEYDYDEYKKKVYASSLVTMDEEYECRVNLKPDSAVRPEQLEGYLNPGSDYVADNVIDFIESFILNDADGSQEFTSAQKDGIRKAIKDVYAYAYADGRKHGLSDGMFAIDYFYDFPLDGAGQKAEKQMLKSKSSAMGLYQEYFELPSCLDCQWVYTQRRFPPEVIKEFAQKHHMTVERAIFWLEKVGLVVHGHQLKTEPGKIQHPKWMFKELLYVFDLFDLDYVTGLRYYNDTCQFYADNKQDTRKKDVDWELAANAFSEIDLEAFAQNIAIDDIFAGR